MRVIRYNIKTKEIVEDYYPRANISEPIENLDKNLEFYYIIENNINNFNYDQYNISYVDELTNNYHSDYKHLKICNRNYKLIEKPKEEIIQKLNDELGKYLDEAYPLAIRIKHLDEFLNEPSPERMEYIISLKKWLKECRDERQKRENKYLNEENSIFPEFGNYPLRP